MSKPLLTEKQAAVYKFLVTTMSNSIPPSVREICTATKIKSTSTVHAILKTLEEYGYIRRDPHFSRAIRIENAAGSTSVPVLGKVTAGSPILAFEDISEYIPYPSNNKDTDGLFALNVSGLSMKNAGILDGDIIIADKNLTASNGDIVVALIEDEATVKRLLIENNRIVLMPENEDFSPIYAENVQILGKVVGNFRRY